MKWNRNMVVILTVIALMSKTCVLAESEPLWGDTVESKIDVIDDELSLHDEIINSKIGDLEDSGSCLETLIDVPTDINNLDLNVIELLKTILLELRGCNAE